MMHFKLWLVENSTKGKNQLATLVQQGVGAGDRGAWQAILQMVKEKDEMQMQALRQIVSGYVNHGGKAGAAARYLMDTIAEIDNESDREHYGQKSQDASNDVQEMLFKHHIPEQLTDQILGVIEGNASEPSFYQHRHYLGDNRSGKLMAKMLPLLVQVAEHLYSMHDEKTAKDALIEILGTMYHFSDHIPTTQMILNKLHQAAK